MAVNMKSRKSPWIPPPGRSSREDKVEKSQPMSTITPHDTTTKQEEHMDDDISEISHVSSTAFSVGTPCQVNVNISSIKRDMKQFSTYFTSLKPISIFLNGFFQTSGIHDQVIMTSLSKVESRIKEFIYEFDELEYSVTLVENTLHESNKTDEYFKTLKLKENLLSKLLECYSNCAVIFQAVVQKQITGDITKFQKDHDLLRKQLETTEKKCTSQEAVITDLERRLSIFQGKTNTLESYNSTLEATKAELQKQLSYKEAQIKYLNSELSQLSAASKGASDSEKLLEVIEEIKKVSSAEKTALKKALKLEKMHVKQRDESIQKFQKDLKNKADMLFDVAAQRDKLKSYLTVANNKIVEGKNEIEELKSQNLKLQNELCQKESSLKKDIQDISDTLKAKAKDMYDMEQENNKLKKLAESLQDDLKQSIEELRITKSKLSDPNVYLSKDYGGKNENPIEEIKHLISLLKDSKEYFKTIKAVHSSEEIMQNEKYYNSISVAIGEMKSYLLEIRELCGSFHKDNASSELEKQLQELKCVHNETSKENERLKSEIDEMKNSRAQHLQILPGNYPAMDNQFMAKNIQTELNLKTEENWRLKQREKDLEHQLEEVKEKLQKREIENGKLFSLEEDLKTKKMEVSLLNKKLSEESERSAEKIKSLTEALDKRYAEYDNLEQYVQTLKTSYLNVFGNT